MTSEIKKVGSTYFAVMEEWMYPNGQRTLHVDNFDTRDMALKVAKECCENEVEHFAKATGSDPIPPNDVVFDLNGKEIGYCLTPKNGLDDWFYFAHVVEIQFGL